MTIDDERLAALLEADRDALMRGRALPTASQALWRVRITRRRRHAGRVSALVEWASVAMAAAIALVLLLGVIQRGLIPSTSPSTGRVVVAVMALAIVAAAAALGAMREPARRYRRSI